MSPYKHERTASTEPRVETYGETYGETIAVRPLTDDDLAAIEARYDAACRVVGAGDDDGATLWKSADVPDLVAEVRRLRAALTDCDDARKRNAEHYRDALAAIEAHRAVADCVRREHEARAAWLASLPAGSCTSPPPAALLDAEAATGAALALLDGRP